MKSISKLPDLTKSYAALKLINQIEKNINSGTAMGETIARHIGKQDYPVMDILTMIAEQAFDDPFAMYKVIGEDCTEAVLKFIKPHSKAVL